jgi:predicted metal-binding membrane protein
MSAPAQVGLPTGGGFAPALSAVRTRLGLVLLLFVLAAIGWWWTADQMQGMDNGPWTGLGAFGWFIAVWVVMMAAMMFPSVAPTVALYSRMTRQRAPGLPLVFVSGYLLTWAAAGVLAYAIGVAISSMSTDLFRWDGAGRWTAGATLIVAAGYELTRLKDVCLAKCRSPLGFMLSSWRDGTSGAFQMGAKNGAWCVGCCWALMASLFALGVMSIVWMAVVASLIAAEKIVPWRRVAHGTAAVLLVLGVFLLFAPAVVPGLTTPGHMPMDRMMGSSSTS